MKAHRVALVCGFGALVACVASQGDPSPGGAPGGDVLDLGATHPTRTLTSPRVLDWSSQRYDGRATYGMSARDVELANRAAPMAAPVANWIVQTGGPVTSQPAVFGASWTAPTSYDMLFFGVNATKATSGISSGASSTALTSNFFALTGLYTSTPTLAWAASAGTGNDRSAVALSLDGTKVFWVANNGKLFCYQTGWVASGTVGPYPVTATPCGGSWTDYKNASCTTALDGTSVGVNGSSPWIDYASATHDIYFGDNCGYVNHVNGTTGHVVWSTQIGLLPSGGAAAAFESSPVVVGGILYIGDDAGRMYKVNGATSSSAPVAANVATFDACSAVAGSAPCAGFVASGAGAAPSPWAFRAPIGYDVANSHVYAVSNDYVFELTGAGTTLTNSSSASPKHLNSGGTGPMYSAPTLDTTNHYLYTQFNSTLFKLTTPFAAASAVYSTLLANRTTDTLSSPLPYANAGAVYVGDSSGVIERFDCNASAGVPMLDGLTSSTATPFGGNAITTGIGIDNKTGDIVFGFSTVSSGTPGSTGGIALVPQAEGASYVCPAATPKLCAGMCAGGTGDACSQCCVAADCPTVAHATATACTAGVCVYSCNNPWTDCLGNIATLGCTNVNTDPNNCGACGTTCSSANVPSPSCTAGTCSGQCADGYVDCDGNRQTNGCETAASCGGCCTAAICMPGQICVDPGYNVNAGNGKGHGACATPAAGQLIQECAEAAEGSTATVTCPAGQPIKQIVFADYGKPSGTCGHSAATSTDVASCSGVALQASCVGPTCAWNSASGTCIPAACSGLAKVACNNATGCTWDSDVTSCVGSIGFRHYYGTSPNNKFSPNCAQDVSASPLALASCIGENSCSFDAANEVYGNSTANDPVAGTTTLPLSPACSAGNNCAANPCPGVAKSLYAQVSCDVCTGKRVFVSKYAYSGQLSDWGGVAGIDAGFCEYDAANAGLTGVYKAWLSGPAAQGGSASTRLTHSTSAYYVLPDGTPLAAGWSQLEAGTFLNSAGINEHADKSTVGLSYVWTGTDTSGATLASCSNWSTTSGTGTAGVAGFTGANWTEYDTAHSCASGAVFYCIEQ